MAIVQELSLLWSENRILMDGVPIPTFIEEVGLACAENVRSAAICRWMNNHQQEALEWLKSLECMDVPERVAFQREISFSSNDENDMCRRSRIDIGIYNSETKSPVAFIELKWLAEASEDQLNKYRQCINESYPESLIPILVFCPVLAVEGVVSAPVELVSLFDYSRLSCIIKHLPEQRLSIEDDLALTLERWELFTNCIRKNLKKEGTRISEFTDLDSWLMDCSPALTSYSDLFRRILVADLADTVSTRVANGLRRTLTAKGPRGDMQADIAGGKDFSFFQNPKAHNQGHGMLVNVRIRIPKGRFNEIQVSLGSSFLPYSSESDPGESEFCKYIRGKIAQVLKSAGMKVLSGNSMHRWKCSHTMKFSGDNCVGDVIAYAVRLTRILQNVSESVTQADTS